jgi:hypothetical protein
LTWLTSGQRSAGGGGSWPARCGGLLLGEWTKIRSVRSTVWTLIVFVPGMVALSALGAHVAAHRGPNPPPGSHNDPLSFILGFPLVRGPLGNIAAQRAKLTHRPNRRLNRPGKSGASGNSRDGSITRLRWGLGPAVAACRTDSDAVRR